MRVLMETDKKNTKVLLSIDQLFITDDNGKLHISFEFPKGTWRIYRCDCDYITERNLKLMSTIDLTDSSWVNVEMIDEDENFTDYVQDFICKVTNLKDRFNEIFIPCGMSPTFYEIVNKALTKDIDYLNTIPPETLHIVYREIEAATLNTGKVTNYTLSVK